MTIPIFELVVTLNIPASVGETVGYNYDQNTTAMYDVTGTITNYNGIEADVYLPGAVVPFTSTVAGVFTDLNILLPELRQYVVKFPLETTSTTISVTPDHFTNFTESLLLSRSIAVNRKISSIATKYGYPAVEIEYNGPSLTDYAESRFTENDIVPYYLSALNEPVTVLDPTTAYLDTTNQPFLISYDASILLTPTGESFTIKDGYSYLSFFATPGSIKLESLFMSISKTGIVGSGIQINIYGGDVLAPLPGVLATSTVPHINIADVTNVTEFKLDNELTINGFWIQIIPLNFSSEYDIALAAESFNTTMKVSRYTRLYNAGAYQGQRYLDVLQTNLTTLYGISNPIFVSKAVDLVILNKLYQEAFAFTTGFDGPAIVCYKEISLIQIADKSVPYGPSGYKSVESIVSYINSIPNYAAFVLLPGNVSEKSLFIEYYEPELNVTTPVANIELTFSSLVSPDGNSRKVLVRTTSVMTKYEEKRSVLLKEPYIDGNEWHPVVTGGHMRRPDLKIGDTVFVNGFGYDTVNSVSDGQFGLVANAFATAPEIYAVEEPLNYSVLMHSEQPLQVTKNTFQLSKAPLYIDNTDQPSLTFMAGPKYATNLTAKVVDWDIDSSVIVLNTDVRYDINKYIKYMYIEKGDIISSINLKDSLDSVVDIYVDPYGNVVTSEQNGLAYFVDVNRLYLLIGSYFLSNLTKPEDIEIRDVRLKGGGIVKDIEFMDAFKKNVGIIGFYDIGFYDGMNIPQMVLAVDLPSEIKTRFDSYEVDNILHTHANAGTKIYARYPVNLYTFASGGTDHIGLEDETGSILLEDNSGSILTEQ